MYVGLFGYIEDSAIKNVGVVDSYFNGSSEVGGLCGRNVGTITNCYNKGTVSGTESIGGVCGINSPLKATPHNAANKFSQIKLNA